MVVAIAAPIPRSGRMRLPVDVWAKIRDIGEGCGNASSFVVVTLCLRTLVILRAKRRRFSRPDPESVETSPGRMELADETWELVKEFSRQWGTTTPHTVADAVRVVHSLIASRRLPKDLAMLLTSSAQV